MSWIATLEYEESSGRLRALYDRVRAANGQIDAILRLHALRPHTLEGHLALYKAVLHHSGNRLPAWLLETIGLWVSLLNGCGYCVEHHAAGLVRALGGALPGVGRGETTVAGGAGGGGSGEARERALRIRAALEAGEPERALDGRASAALRYAEKLTRTPRAVSEADVEALRRAGLEDGEILEVNQVTSYFAYANRTVLGLGARLDGETLGLSPPDSEDPREWTHR